MEEGDSAGIDAALERRQRARFFVVSLDFQQ